MKSWLNEYVYELLGVSVTSLTFTSIITLDLDLLLSEGDEGGRILIETNQVIYQFYSVFNLN